MTVKVIPYTFSGAVVKNGTFTVGYPAGYTKGSFAEGKIRKIIVNQTLLTSPVNFTVSFGATSATVTYLGNTPIASGTPATVEFDIPGEAAYPAYQNLVVGQVNRIIPLLVDLGSPLLAVTTAFISAATSTELPNAGTKSYTTASIGTSPADGANTTWIQDIPRNLTITASHNSSIVATTVNITGKDVSGDTMYETFSITATGTSKTATGLKAFYKITQIDIVSASDSTGNTISVGFGNALGLPVFVSDVREVLAEIQDGALVGALGGPVRLPFYLDVADTSTGTAASAELTAPCDGVITRLGTQVRVAISTGGTVTAAVGTTAVVGLSVTVANSATKGTQGFSIPTLGDATAIVAKDNRIQVIPADAFTGGGSIEGFLEITPTGLKGGVLAKGLSPNTASTSTTADVLGTYTPNSNVVMDGTIGFILLLMLANPSYQGNPQYHL